MIRLLAALLFLVGCTSTNINLPREELVIESNKNSITNFQVTEDGLYRGGRISSLQVKQLAETYKVKTIISLETYWSAPGVKHDEIDTAAELGIKFIHIPMQPMGDVHADLVWKAVELLRNEARPIYLHCYRGSERTGLVIAAYRMKYENWTYGQATDEMDKYGFSPMFNEWKKMLKR